MQVQHIPSQRSPQQHPNQPVPVVGDEEQAAGKLPRWYCACLLLGVYLTLRWLCLLLCVWLLATVCLCAAPLPVLVGCASAYARGCALLAAPWVPMCSCSTACSATVSHPAAPPPLHPAWLPLLCPCCQLLPEPFCAGWLITLARLLHAAATCSSRGGMCWRFAAAGQAGCPSRSGQQAQQMQRNSWGVWGSRASSGASSARVSRSRASRSRASRGKRWAPQ